MQRNVQFLFGLNLGFLEKSSLGTPLQYGRRRKPWVPWGSQVTRRFSCRVYGDCGCAIGQAGLAWGGPHHHGSPLRIVRIGISSGLQVPKVEREVSVCGRGIARIGGILGGACLGAAGDCAFSAQKVGYHSGQLAGGRSLRTVRAPQVRRSSRARRARLTARPPPQSRPVGGRPPQI